MELVMPYQRLLFIMGTFAFARPTGNVSPLSIPFLRTAVVMSHGSCVYLSSRVEAEVMPRCFSVQKSARCSSSTAI
jgi:hypothetical protein